MVRRSLGRRAEEGLSQSVKNREPWLTSPVLPPSSAKVLECGASCQEHDTLSLCMHVCVLCAHATHTPKTTSSLPLQASMLQFPRGAEAGKVTEGLGNPQAQKLGKGLPS